MYIHCFFVHSPSHVQLFVTPWTAAPQASLSLIISQFAQVHVHCIGDAIQPSHSLMPSPPPTLNLSRHQGLLKWVGCSHQVTKMLHLQHQSFQWIFRTGFPLVWLVWSPCSPREFQESSPAPQFKGVNSLVLYLLYSPALTTIYDHLTVQTFVNRVMSCFSTHCLGLS